MKQKFIETYNREIKRDGAKELLGWLESSDFFTAPASTRYHSSYEGGLVGHSLTVFEELSHLLASNQSENLPSAETVAIIGLLHDVCKVNFYKEDTRNVKLDGVWKQVPYYTVDEKFPFGHGEKSVFLIERFMKLTLEEAVAIRFHMGAYEGEQAYNNIALAYKKYPVAFYTHFADMKATHIREE